jgi:putative transposase
MTNITTTSSIALVPGLEAAWRDVDSSFDRFCLVAGIGAMEQVLREDAQRLTGPRHGRCGGRVGQRWGMTKGKIGFHGGNVAVQRPRVRSYDGYEVELSSWTAAQAEDWLGRWAMNLMLINVSTRKLRFIGEHDPQATTAHGGSPPGFPHSIWKAVLLNEF